MATDDQPRNGFRLTHAVRPFPVVLPALPDELLSSWFQRHANFYGVSGGRLLRHCGLDAVSLRSLDLALTAYNQRRLAHVLRSEQRVIRKMMQSCGRSRPEGLIATDRPIQVCKRCRGRHQAEPETRGARLRSWMEGWRLKLPPMWHSFGGFSSAEPANEGGSGRPAARASGRACRRRRADHGTGRSS
jgi:hypothetical protein